MSTPDTITGWKQQLRGQAGLALKAIKDLALPKTATDIMRYMRTLMTAEKMIRQFWEQPAPKAAPAEAAPTDMEIEAMAEEAIEAALAEMPILNRQQRRALERRERKRPGN